MRPVVNLVFDSGAYSAWTQKKPINIDKYCDFLLANRQHIHHAVNLDSINPGNPDLAAQEGWNNYLYMRDKDLDVMPVFHARERVSWLEKMLDATDYIGLSGTSLVSPAENHAWHQIMWNYLTDAEGKAVAGFHAFGDTAPFSMKTYPWRSADSATWQITSGRTGCVMIDGKPYQIRTNKIRNASFLSSDDPTPKKKMWEEALTKRGVNVDLFMSKEMKAVELTAIRCYLNAAYMLELQESSRNCTKFDTKVALIGDKCGRVGKERVGPLEMYFVVSTAVCGWALPILARLGITNILLSYYYCEPKFFNKEFIPYLYDPVGQCQSNPRFKKYWDLLDEILLPPKVAA